MTIKFSTLSLVSILGFMSCANAAKLEIQNIDIPDSIDGHPMKAQISFMGKKPPHYTTHVVDLATNKLRDPQKFEIPSDDVFGDIRFSISPVDMYAPAPHLSSKCNLQDIETKEDKTVAISVSYSAEHQSVTCDIVTPD